MQNEVESQYSDLLSQSQAAMSMGDEDEGEAEREARDLGQQLFQAQQELMTAQAECDRAQRVEQETHDVWEAKRSVPA